MGKFVEQLDGYAHKLKLLHEKPIFSKQDSHELLESDCVTPSSGPSSWFSRWMATGSDIRSRNARNVVLDGIAIGYASAAALFLPVFLAQLGAVDFAVGLLTAMPAFAGLLFALPVGRFLSRQRQVVPWYATARFLVVSAYALTGLVIFFVTAHRVEAILAIWALMTLPQTIADVGFTVVMAGAAGTEGRFYILSRRWASLSLTTAVTVASAGFVLDRLTFPLNYQIVFIVLSLGGLFSYHFSNRIVLLPQDPPAARSTVPLGTRVQTWVRLVGARPKFFRVTASQFVYRFGLAWALPLFPLYYVHTLHANDVAIGLIYTVQSGVLFFAYLMWTQIARRRGVRLTLLLTTGAMGFYPIVLALTQQMEIVIILAGLAGVFAAGIDLVFFDRLVSTFPPESSAMFAGLNQTTVYIATFIAPLVGTTLSEHVGISGALIAAGIVRLIGFGLFAYMAKE